MSERKTGKGSEIHQTARNGGSQLTTNQGLAISDNQNSLKAGVRGPSLLEDFILREKITHFDHERIPERIVHARGSGAHGFFECTKPMGKVTKAGFLQKKGQRTPVFVRFSTVAGNQGSKDTPRDVRGFATKFYTQEGNFDLVGNNIPVFFIQDGIKFPDLVHAVKPEPHDGMPQAASAHDTFWDFISLTPESTHMIMWAMSDRALPRSFRMMEGFGVHTFRLIDSAGESRFVKFHWRPKLGAFSHLWDEAVKVSGADPDFQRRDLWEAIDRGDYPEFELSLQVFTEEQADSFDFDVLDPTKIIPEEQVPLEVCGRMVLDRNPDNFFAETEQVAFCPSHMVPGIGFSNDPLLQARLFSYLDTQLSRLGSPNFHELPINAPKCPFANHQRDGHMRHTVNKGPDSYEPNSIAPKGPREHPTLGYDSFPEPLDGEKLRQRAESFGDHYSQAELFWISQTEVEQEHIVSAFNFELSKVKRPHIREAVLANLRHVSEDLAERVAESLNMPLPAPSPADGPRYQPEASPALSIVAKAPKSLAGKTIGCLVSDGVKPADVNALKSAVKEAGGQFQVIAPRIGGAEGPGGKKVSADRALPEAPSILFDAVAILGSEEGIEPLLSNAAAKDFASDAFAHLKVILADQSGQRLLERAGLNLEEQDEGMLLFGKSGERDQAFEGFISAAKKDRVWSRREAV